jgi:hypothetical protein
MQGRSEADQIKVLLADNHTMSAPPLPDRGMAVGVLYRADEKAAAQQDAVAGAVWGGVAIRPSYPWR